MKLNPFIRPLLTVTLGLGAIDASELKEQFEAQRSWNYFGNVQAADRNLAVAKKGDDVLVNIDSKGKLQKANFLVSKEKYQDFQLKMEFMIPKGADSGIYVMGRYEIQFGDSAAAKKPNISSMGAVAQRWDNQRNPKGYEGVAPKVNAAKPAGEWQSLEITFRAPRFAKDGSKTHHAKFVKVLLNGQLVHENQIVKGPSRSSAFADETGKPEALFIQGKTSPIAIRKFEVKKLELSTDGEKPLSGSEAAPLDRRGQPLVNSIQIGREVFQAKGCIECHGITDGEVKTGPSLYGLFTLTGKRVKVLEPGEGHRKELPADLAYLKNSIRRPHEALSLKPDGTPHLPIMPGYDFKAINEDEIQALYSYLRTLNPAKEAGPKVIWKKKPAAKYQLEKDPIAILVKDFPRLERADMGEHISGRAYHVGLPGDISYSFDPRNMAIAQVWDGPFIQKKDQVSRGLGGAALPGFNSRDYKIANLFQPYDAQGALVDLSYTSPPAMYDIEQSAEFVQDKSDFLKKVNAYTAKFLGVTTPKQKVPTFHYQVDDNLIDLTVDIDRAAKLTATLNLRLKTAQQLAIPGKQLKDISVSLGEIRDGKWLLPAGDHASVTFTATLPKLSGALYTSDVAATESYAPQKLQWLPSKKAATLPEGYRIEDGTPPTDPFGRELMFEPLGIEFHQGEAFVSTRTAGVWKVVDGHWHLFAEGAYESIGMVVNSSDDVVIGEKAGLTRLIDRDHDHWAEKRVNITDKFRFNGGYHEYLHGPIKRDGEYLFTLNLSHEVKGAYKAGGKYMGSRGGLRGWMLSSDEQGDTELYASGFRSPAGLALSPENEIVYSENQGEFVGTSKMFKVKKGKFYGNPTGLIDLPGMNDSSPEVQWDKVKATRELPFLLLPHGEVMNTPGSPEFLTDKISFGPFQGQMFLGDQMQSNIYRIDTQVVDGQEQGVTLPFAEGLESGAVRIRFNPADSSLWIGQTGRGWRALGGQLAAFQRIVYDPSVAVDAIKTVKATAKGFDVHFTQPQSGTDETANIQCDSWYYQNSANYGSPKMGVRKEKVSSTRWNAEKTICHVTLDDFKVKRAQSDHSARVFRLNLANTAYGKKHGPFLSKAYYTLYKIPKS
ncbi:DUF1080 domain-containing protein [Verrucomicrobiaceae bacterium R5-34]|nr:DUF1080 domain-containing protein [Verrucomicrobiaceae bacterium R5-34]